MIISYKNVKGGDERHDVGGAGVKVLHVDASDWMERMSSLVMMVAMKAEGRSFIPGFSLVPSSPSEIGKSTSSTPLAHLRVSDPRSIRRTRHYSREQRTHFKARIIFCSGL
ncbi:unnamed protein product [Fraxinus pennsylvanica]|uniref:Uncharacterized protein n=1 Tax=Fraxinus pennsylvanica TaxID=56036 RepID=A0AAD2DGR9_9LAMI|nr:unnamed protein product [Fraxinus pennsylvanica]